MGQGTELYPERHERTPNTQVPNLSVLLQEKALRFDYKRTDGTKAWAVVTVAGGQQTVLDSSPLPEAYVLPYASTWRLAARAAELYTEVVKAGQETELLMAVRSIAPEINQLRMLTWAGEPTLFANTADGDLMPLQLFGDGLARVTSWVLNLLQMKDNLLVIDEIENGIHHTALASVWQVLLETAKQNNVQIFATTHSYEALAALNQARQAISKNAPTIRVIRLQRVKGDVRVVTYTEEVLDAAVTSEVEVR